jgi:hypothetical protein
MIRGSQLDPRVGRDGGARLRDNLTVNGDMAGEDDGARPFPRLDESAFDERDVEPCLSFCD